MVNLKLVQTTELPPDEIIEFKSEAEQRFKSPALVRATRWYRGQPYRSISKAAVDLMMELSDVGKPYKSNMRIVIRLFDIYLQLTGQRISLRGGRISARVALDFGGALYSEKFMFADAGRRFDLLTALRRLLDEMNLVPREEFPFVSTIETTPYWQQACARFDSCVLDEEVVKRVRGWPVLNNNGVRWLNLCGIHERYGEGFALKFQRATQSFFDKRNQESVHQIAFLIDYLAVEEKNWSTSDFDDAEKTYGLFVRYYDHFVKCKSQEHEYPYVYANWTKCCNFLRKGLFEANVIAEPAWELPTLPAPAGNETHVRTDETGRRYKAKLLPDVPLRLTNEAAAQLLFENIQRDVETVKKWADAGIAEMWRRRERFIELAAIGEVREIVGYGQNVKRGSTKRSHDSWQANVCATYTARGFETSGDNPYLNLLFGRRVKDVYALLALPTAGTLLPHMAALVLEHSNITPSFLEELVLYDSHEHIVGVSEIDTAWILDGKKLRKGPDTAQQKIALTDRAAEIVAQVLELTKPLRIYLKDKGDPAWRRVFLETGKGFDYPSVVTPTRRTSGKDNVNRLAAEFRESCNLDASEAHRLASRFSLVALRATKVVERYLEKPDLSEAAKALGHERLSFRQIECYVPKALVAWFEERWVRLFQNGAVAQALEGSEFLLEATDFESFDELHEFLSNHALKVRPMPGKKVRSSYVFDEQVYFAASVETLAALESIRRSVQKAESMVSALAVEWADYADRLFAFIKHAHPPREELLVMLEDAQAEADNFNFDELIYA